MHSFFVAVEFFVSLLMRISMLFTGEKTNYLRVPKDVIPELTVGRICRIGHVFPSFVVSLLIGIKVLPQVWPYYALELEKNSGIVPLAIFLLFIPVAIINGIVVEKVLSAVNPRYFNFKKSF